MAISNVDLLILGAGWTSTFLIPLFEKNSISYAATTRSGSDGTILFTFDPQSDDVEPYKRLPTTRTIVIMFPIIVSGASERLIKLYVHSRPSDTSLNSLGIIQLGTSGIWEGNRVAAQLNPSPTVDGAKWFDRHSPITATERSKAEDELLALSGSSFDPSQSGSPIKVFSTVLNLSGLWGGSRSPKNWLSRVATTKETLAGKGALHLIHGVDVSRAILAIHSASNFEDKAAGQRWLLSDGRIYDWWDLAGAWGTGSQANAIPYPEWVRELQREQGIRGLPRPVENLGRALDSREFWETFQLSPSKTLFEQE